MTRKVEIATFPGRMPAASEGFPSVFRVFLKLGLTSFGGPVAHLGYFHRELVVGRRWVSEEAYGEMVALSQALPGPASSQVGMMIGLARAGFPGLCAAWIGFTLPSALLLLAFGLGLARFGAVIPAGLIHGLKVAAVAVVAQALWAMGRRLCRGPLRLALALAAAAVLVAFPHSLVQVAVLATAALAGSLLIPPGPAPAESGLPPPLGRRAGSLLLLLFLALLLLLPVAGKLLPGGLMSLGSACYRAGALVFGGGHVVLPLLQAGVVSPGLIGEEAFLAGYAAAQAVPGPLFTFAAYLGAVIAGWQGASAALGAIFLPSFLLVPGVLPFWERLKSAARFRSALAGVNAAVVGLLAAALWHPVGTSAIRGPWDAALAGMALLALLPGKVKPGWVVLGTALAAWGTGILELP